MRLRVRDRYFSRDHAVRHERDRRRPIDPSQPLRPVAPNSPIPRPALRAQSSWTETRGIVMRVIENHSKLLPGKLGRLFRLSHATAVKLTGHYTTNGAPISERAWRDALDVLVTQHSLVAWNIVQDKEVPRRIHDGAGVTCYRVPTWKETCERRRQDPKIGKIPGGRLGDTPTPYIIGKEKRFLSQVELDSYGIDADKAAQFVTREIGRQEPEREGPVFPAAAGEMQQSAQDARPAAPSNGPPSVGSDPCPKKIRDAFRQAIDGNRNFSQKEPKQLIAAARALAIHENEPLTDQEIADCIADARSKTKNVGTIAFFGKALPDAVAALFMRRSDQREKAAAYELRRAENGGICPTCKGVQLVNEVIRGIGQNVICRDCAQARAAS